MTAKPQASTDIVREARTAPFAALGDRHYARVEPARFPQAILRFRNDRAAASVALDGLSDAQWIAHFGRFEPLPGNLPQPLALAYHGHQFRAYNPEIGDGRGFLFAQLRDDRGRLLDLGTKGSGQTPFSRHGDGRLTLKGGVREILATEMLDALGVETSKSFSLIETGEALWRGDEPSPTRSAVLVRLSHGHVRIGSFQRLAWLGDETAMRDLVRYCHVHLFDRDGDDGPAALLDEVVARTARLAASYMAAGFVHGVLNSDNINITGESFDYGPWRFTPHFDPAFTAAYFDHAGLYSFARQAEAIQWDVMQLAGSLRLIEDSDPLVAALRRFADSYHAALLERILWRLGVAAQPGDSDRALVAAIEQALIPGDVTIDRFFFDWRGGRLRDPDRASTYAAEHFDRFRALVAERDAVPGATDHDYWTLDAPCSMHVGAVEAIWRAIDGDDDWQPFAASIAAIRAMGEAMHATRA